MTATFTLQTSDPALVAVLQTSTLPAGVNLHQEPPAAARTDGLIEVTIRHAPVVTASLDTAWLWPLLQGYDSLLLTTRR